MREAFHYAAAESWRGGIDTPASWCFSQPTGGELIFLKSCQWLEGQPAGRLVPGLPRGEVSSPLMLGTSDTTSALWLSVPLPSSDSSGANPGAIVRPGVQFPTTRRLKEKSELYSNASSCWQELGWEQKSMWNLTAPHVLSSPHCTGGFLRWGGRGLSMCLGATTEKHTWDPQIMSLWGFVCCVHLEERGQAVQLHHDWTLQPPGRGTHRTRATLRWGQEGRALGCSSEVEKKRNCHRDQHLACNR